MVSFLFSVSLIFNVITIGHATLVYRYNASQVTWEEARSECQSKGGNLVNGSLEQQLRNCSFPQHVNFWVGTYDTLSSWIQIMGCYRKNETTTTSDTYITDDIVTCSENCPNLFGMNNQTCYCFPDNWLTQSEIVPDSFCNTSCGENQYDSCGGNGYLTVYKKVAQEDVRDRDDEPDKNAIKCGLIECTDLGWTYFGYSCYQSLTAYCNDLTTVNEQLTWEDAQSRCWDRHDSFLLSNSKDSMQCDNSTSKAPHWVGLFRRNVTRITQGDSLSTVTECLSGVLSAGVLRLNRNVDCQLQLPFVCELDTNDILQNDCLLEPFDMTSTFEATTVPTTTEETTVSVITEEPTVSTTATESTSTQTGDQSTTEHVSTSSGSSRPSASVTPSPRKEETDSGGIDTGFAVALGFALAIPTALAIGSIICHCCCGKRSNIIQEDKVQLRNKEEFYIRQRSSDISELDIRYSLFNDDNNDMKELVPNDSDSGLDLKPPYVNYVQKQDGRFTTFLTIENGHSNKGEPDEGVVNTEESWTKL